MKFLQSTHVKYGLVLFAIVFAFSVFAFFFGNHKVKERPPLPAKFTKPLTTEQYVKARDQYIMVLNKKTPMVALTKLREQIKHDTALLRSCHALAHDIGHAAYKKYNDFGEALKYRDEICNSGYLHGIIETKFANATDIVEAIKTVCSKYSVESFIGWECNHGIGHGVMYYTVNDLPKSLQLCQTLTEKFATSSCINGVFMENFNTDQKLHSSQYLKEKDPFYPCREQKKEHKADCYLYAPTYYLALHTNDYSGALRWCKTAEQQFQSICARGVGNQTIKENITTPKLAERICMHGKKDQVSPCITGIVSVYINHFGSTEPAKKLCTTFERKNKNVCNQVVTSRAKFFKI